MEVYIKLCVTAVYSRMIYEALWRAETDSSRSVDGFLRDAERSGYCCSTIITSKFINKDYLQKPGIEITRRGFTSVMTHENISELVRS